MTRSAAEGQVSQSPVAVRAFVSGRVQGVGFREACRRAARQAGVGGWVRNMADGRVEAWFEGDRDAVDRVLAWCGHGPSWAAVSGVEIHDEPARGAEGFEVR
jgi:acylphosphatase